jgi:hypothetical protein
MNNKTTMKKKEEKKKKTITKKKFIIVVLEFELRAYTLSHSTSPCFCDGFFEIQSHELFAQAWLPTMILLISAS